VLLIAKERTIPPPKAWTAAFAEVPVSTTPSIIIGVMPSGRGLVC
jgi:hypothetical protein